MKQLLFYIAFFIISVNLCSQEREEVKFDNEYVEQKRFDAKRIEAYKEQEDFIYTIEKREPNILEKIWDWFKRTVKRILSYFFDDIAPAVGFLRFILRALPYIIAGLVLFFIIKFFLKVNVRNILEGKTSKPIVNLSDEEELIRDRDLSKLIQSAITEKNYQLAVRYYYLLLLKSLYEKEFISWQQEKTNEDYIKELSTTQFHNEFEKLTYLYDYVWYGDFLIDEAKFKKAEANFKKVIAKI